MESGLNLVTDPDKKVPTDSSLEWRFSDKAVTAWGGLRVMKEMLIQIGFRAVLQQSGLPQPQSNRGYDPVKIMESFLVCIWIGGIRFSHTAIVRFDEALRQIFGWDEVACVSTFTRFFNRFNRQKVDVSFGYLQQWFWEQISPKTLTLDLDSSVMTRDGEQEGVAVGYNPHKKGRASHHPLFAFAADLRMVLHAWLRPGNTGACNGVDIFFQEAVSLLHGRHQIGLVRADSGFFVGTLMQLLEDNNYHYIIAAKLNNVIRQRLGGLTNWINLDSGIAVAELRYAAADWDKERRLIVVRQEIAERPQAKGRLLLELPGYRYQTYVTDLALPAPEIWRLYRGRADSENRIEELKYDFGVTGFCLNSFYATEAAFRTVLLAYNLMSLFRQAILQAPKAVRLATMRFQCFAIGSWIGREARKKILRISLPWQRRAWFEGLFTKIEHFQ